MKVLIIGLNPSKLGGKSPTLIMLSKWTEYLQIKNYSFVNLYDGFKIETSNVEIDCVKGMVNEYDKVICLGRIVSVILYKNNIDHFKLPHPSPRNRLLNNPCYVLNELSECKEYLYRR